jgi:hypothetical protein
MTVNIKYIISLGEKCHTSSFLKRNYLKKASYPFDWIFSNPYSIMHCLDTKFKIFLDKSYYTFNNPNIKIQTHSFYYPDGLTMFNHHNPLNLDDFNYFERCIERLNNVLESDENKLFIIMFVNNKFEISDYIQDIILLNNKLKEHTKNHKLLFILHKCIGYQWHEWKEIENIDVLELYTCVPSVGTEFGFNVNDIVYPFEKDNVYMDEIIKSKYDFSSV